MRFLLKFHVPTMRYGPEDFRNGALVQDLETLLLEPLRPEATYFTLEGGQKTGLVVFELDEASKIPACTESCAHIGSTFMELLPVMNVDELRYGLPEVANVLERVEARKATGR